MNNRALIQMGELGHVIGPIELWRVDLINTFRVDLHLLYYQLSDRPINKYKGCL